VTTVSLEDIRCKEEIGKLIIANAIRQHEPPIKLEGSVRRTRLIVVRGDASRSKAIA